MSLITQESVIVVYLVTLSLNKTLNYCVKLLDDKN